MIRSTARVTVGDQVWSVREDAAARWAITTHGVPRPLPTDEVDTTGTVPRQLDGTPIPGARWATPGYMTRLGMLTAGAGRIGGDRS